VARSVSHSGSYMHPQFSATTFHIKSASLKSFGVLLRSPTDYSDATFSPQLQFICGYINPRASSSASSSDVARTDGGTVSGMMEDILSCTFLRRRDFTNFRDYGPVRLTF
jgi:hypothetical protein